MRMWGWLGIICRGLLGREIDGYEGFGWCGLFGIFDKGIAPLYCKCLILLEAQMLIAPG